MLSVFTLLFSGVTAHAGDYGEEHRNTGEPAKIEKADTLSESYMDIDFESASLNVNEVTIEVGKSLFLTMTVEPANAYIDSYEWSLSNSEVVDIDYTENNKVKITAFATGDVVITGTAYDEDYNWIEASCTIHSKLKESDQKLINAVKNTNLKIKNTKTYKYSAVVTIKKNNKLKGVRYQLAFRPRGRNSWDTLSYKNEKIKVRFLFSNTKYQIRLRSYKYIAGKYYYGPWTSIKNIRTKK